MPLDHHAGIIDVRHAGITVMCDPENMGSSEHFKRDHGLLVDKPFTSKPVVKLDESLRLHDGVLVHSGSRDTPPDLEATYTDFLSTSLLLPS